MGVHLLASRALCGHMVLSVKKSEAGTTQISHNPITDERHFNCTPRLEKSSDSIPIQLLRLMPTLSTSSQHKWANQTRAHTPESACGAYRHVSVLIWVAFCKRVSHNTIPFETKKHVSRFGEGNCRGKSHPLPVPKPGLHRYTPPGNINIPPRHHGPDVP
ncbi:hypothetical protein F4802DRAFT_509855 [Xylaria palmicola]|nr:hypothetical protein F4802DRAFT_509855 [Xylaria palmicola]